ncbi:MAG: hypothetical protein IJ977_04705 [Fibrobacter sp.]|nr:hypothetical protein [Fibrobacter sp.]MBR2305794.1 hypothetical protein [Fibrobacter sp.]
MAIPYIPTHQDINDAIKKVADIPCQVDDMGFILADGVVLSKNGYDPVNGNYELHVRGKKNDKWKSFDSKDNPNFIEDAARCFVEFYNAKQQLKADRAMPEQEINQLKYMFERIRSILARNNASLDVVPGGLRLRTGEPGPESVNLTLVDQEAV